MRAQETRSIEAAQDARQQPSEQTAAEKNAPPPADGLLQAGEPSPRASQVVDGDFIFTSPGRFAYARDIRLSDSSGGLRLIGADSLASSPAGAAIQLFGNNVTPFPGQLFLDSGADDNAALIFRTAQTGGTITERMRVGSDGNVVIGTTNPFNSKLRVVTGSGGPFNGVRSDNTGGGNGLFGSSASGVGVSGSSNGSNGSGVLGSNTNGTGVRGSSTNSIGVVGTSINGTGVLGVSSNGLAGQFSGDVQITGKLTKGSGSFKIDHPLDPENKYLSHSFVESPDMMNIYDGNITTDAKGHAVVELPAYFTALNSDYRYQLTVIGRFARAIVSSEIKNNRFTIKTDEPQVKVSWQVTGTRRDAYAEKHRIKVEENKPANERGTYLHPEAFGQPAGRGVGRRGGE